MAENLSLQFLEVNKHIVLLWKKTLTTLQVGPESIAIPAPDSKDKRAVSPLHAVARSDVSESGVSIAETLFTTPYFYPSINLPLLF